MKRTLAFIPVVMVLAVSACENRNLPPIGRDFGNAVQHNMSQQIVNPEPVTAGYGVTDLDGTRAEGAIDRYKTGTVKQPESLTIESGGSE